jgi:hypothetical protein
MKDFKEIARQETNEFTALILMLGVLSEKLTDITDLLSMSNTLSKEILVCLTRQADGDKKEHKPMRLLSRDDYID